MILKALYDYYHRSGDLAPEGMEYKEIAFLVVIDREGNLVRLEDRRIDSKTSSRFLVVKGMRAGITPKPYTFWDNVEYVLNYTKHHPELKGEDDEDEKLKNERVAAIQKAYEKHSCFIKKCNSIAEIYPDNPGFRAVSLFYAKNQLNKLVDSTLWEQIAKKPTVNISFLLDGELSIIAEHKALVDMIRQEKSESTNPEEDNSPVCLITGNKSIAVESSTPTAIQGGQATGRLVSFQVNSGYDSYGKSQGNNAPVSKKAEACYTTALNKLLAKGSHNKFVISNRTFVFWASSNSDAAKEIEHGVFDLFGYTDNNADDPNKRIIQVRKVFNSVYSGSLNTELKDKFYFLGLAPNSARIAVVFWNESQLKDFAGLILKHFDDMEIVDTRNEKKPYFGMHQMMSAVALKGKASDVSPNLPDCVIKSILQGTPYPYPLFLACINRIRAEQNVTIARAAIVKAYLNRINNTNKITVMLDKDNSNQGYLCGRLFATLEYLQDRGNGASTIRGRYMNSASTTPSVVFPTLLNLSVHHSEKLDKKSQIFFEQVKSEIIDKISSDGFPAHLDLQDQGRFMVGYYHQRQEFYTKKTDTQEINVEQ